MHAFDLNQYDELDKLANVIKNPEIYGRFEDDKAYLATLDLLLASTRETENRYDFFNQHVLSQVCTGSMIDVGVGDGKLTGLVGKYFSEITLVDPSHKALSSAEAYVDPATKLHKIANSIVDTNLPENKYNLAILSHTLYYLPENMWFAVTKKMVSSLKQDGMLVIVMNHGLDKDILADTFGGKRLPVNAFIEDCKKRLSVRSIDVTHSTEYFKTQGLDSMLHIVGLHLYDVGAEANKSQLSEFLSTKRDKLSKLYQFLVYQTFVVIRK